MISFNETWTLSNALFFSLNNVVSTIWKKSINSAGLLISDKLTTNIIYKSVEGPFKGRAVRKIHQKDGNRHVSCLFSVI